MASKGPSAQPYSFTGALLLYAFPQTEVNVFLNSEAFLQLPFESLKYCRPWEPLCIAPMQLGTWSIATTLQCKKTHMLYTELLTDVGNLGGTANFYSIDLLLL